MEIFTLVLDFLDLNIVAAAIAAWATYKVQTRIDRRKSKAAYLLLQDDLQIQHKILDKSFATSEAFRIYINLSLWDNNKAFLAEYASEIFPKYAKWVQLARQYNATHQAAIMLELIDLTTTILTELRKHQ